MSWLRKTKLFLWLRVISGGGEEDQLTPDLLFHLVLTRASRENNVFSINQRSTVPTPKYQLRRLTDGREGKSEHVLKVSKPGKIK